MFFGILLMAAQAAAVAPAPVPTTTTAIVAQKPVVESGHAVLPANTDIILRLDEEVSSKRFKEGRTFRLTVAQDVMLGDYVVIPRGTPANGVVSYRTGKGAFGKSAKMEIDLVEVLLNGRSIQLNGHYRQEGQGNTGATVGTAVAVGVFSAFVTGRSAVFEQGREFRATTRAPLDVKLGS